MLDALGALELVVELDLRRVGDLAVAKRAGEQVPAKAVPVERQSTGGRRAVNT